MHTAYADLFGAISADDAHAEPEQDQLFIEPSGAYPKITIRTTVEIEGMSLDVTLNDMSLSDAVALLKRRGAAAPETAAPVQLPRRRRRSRTHAPTEPAYDVIWLDLGDEPPSERNAQVIQRAAALLDGNIHWTAALAAAEQETQR